MNYKVGDKVRVKSLEELKACAKQVNGYEIYFNEHSFYFVKDMYQFCGKPVTIKEVMHNGYKIEGDNRSYGWLNDMLTSTVSIRSIYD